MVQEAYVFPLSFAQQRLWFLDQLAPGSSSYNADLALPVEGPLDLEALRQSIQDIVARHEVLRTTLVIVGGEPAQVIAPELAIPLSVVDLSDLAPAERTAEAQRVATEEAQQPFDLARGPLLRTKVLRLGAAEHLILLTLHHVVCDGWSLGILFNELSTAYAAYSAGEPSPLRELRIQYADFAVWQRESLQGDTLATQLDYWTHHLAGLPSLQLPTDRPRPPVQSFEGAHHDLELSEALVDKLKALSRAEGVTLFMTLLAAFQVLLHRYTAQDDIVVGTYVANRTRAELEELIGFFVNTLVLRTDLSGDPPFRTALHRAREVALGAYAHQDLPFEKLVAELQPERDLSRNPLCQVTFQLLNLPGRTTTESDAVPPAVKVEPGTAIFDLAVALWENGHGLTGQVEYSTDLFDAETIARLVDHYRTLLEGIIENPDRPLSQLPLLTARERHQLLVEWNDTATKYADRACIHELFDRQAVRTPTALALTSVEGQLTYETLNTRANQLAHALRARGVGAEVVVGLCVERSQDMLVGLLGILKAGGAFLPLDPSYPKDRLAFMMTHARAPILLTQSYLVGAVPPIAEVMCVDLQEFPGDGQFDAPVSGVTPDNLAYVIYTSGSTGRPKGVLGTHRAMLNRFEWMWKTYPFCAGDVCCQKTALSFVDSIWEIFGPLLAGVRTHVLADVVVRDPYALIDALRTENVSRIVIVPSLLRAILETGADLANDLPALTFWIVSGEALPRELVTKFYERARGSTLINLYGSSEVAADVTAFEASDDPAYAVVPIGRPIANVRAYVVDSHRQLVPVGIPGELHIGGAAVARGYLQRPDLTAERFIPDCCSNRPGERLFRTGDRVRYRADGTLEFLGRVDHQIKIRGYRVELEEVEEILRQHAAVRHAIVVPRQQSTSGTQLVAYIIPEPETASSNDTRSGSSSDDQVPRWRMVWDNTYEQPPAQADPCFNIVGWNSSYTGLPIPPDEMREWVEGSVERILAEAPRRILEIGCGTGLLLFRLVPHCSEYIGTDFSPVALQYLARHRSALDHHAARVSLREQPADDFSGIDPHSVDAVILNSVVQYFPSVDYLLRVLEGAVQVVAPGGFIFIGDVRSLPLLEASHTSVEIHRASASLNAEQLRRRVEKRMMQEQELVLDPAFFEAVCDRFPDISAATINLKRGHHHNELTRFRYDVLLRVDTERLPPSIPATLDWQEHTMTASRLTRLLLEPGRDGLGVSRIPNARLQGIVAAFDSLTSAGESSPSAAELREKWCALEGAGIEPETLWTVAEQTDHSVDVRWSAAGPGYCDAVFTRRTTGSRRSVEPRTTVEGSRRRPWSAYANNPAEGAFAQRLVPRLREFLQERLPDYMVPAVFMLLDRLPLTPSGKVDRTVLPAPDRTRPDLDNQYVAPRTALERILARLWSELLGIDHPGVHDNFFTDLGGHSLLATQIVSRLRDLLQTDVPLRQFFEAPTIAGLAESLESVSLSNLPDGTPGMLTADAHDIDLEEGVI